MLLKDARPEDVVRCAAVFGQLAEDVAAARSSCARSAQVVWRGRAGDAYQQELDGLAGRLAEVQAAYDAACDVLLRYARVLEPTREEARTAAALLDTVEQERREALLTGFLLDTPERLAQREALQVRADQLAALAEAQESKAAVVAASGLDELAARAPRSGAATNRFLSQAIKGLVGSVEGPALLARSALQALPFVGSTADRDAARRELAAEAKAMAQPWMAVEQVLEQWREGHGGEAFGSVVGLALTHKWGLKGKDAKLFGTHDTLDDAVMRAIRDVGTDVGGMEWILAREQKLLVEDLNRLENVPLPSVDRLLGEPVDLLPHEAHGGHTLIKHVGRDENFLRGRREFMGGANPPEVSSFASLADAEAAVTKVLADPDNRASLRGWPAVVKRLDLRLVLEQPMTSVKVLTETGRVAPGVTVIVRLVRETGGRIRIDSAFMRSGG